DFYTWLMEQARAIREHRIEDIDWDNVAEELEGLARSEKRGIRIQIARLVEHLLKLTYASAAQRRLNERLWTTSVRSAQAEAQSLIDENPGLKPQLNQIFSSAYSFGRNAALGALNLPDDAIPERPPWT